MFSFPFSVLHTLLRAAVRADETLALRRDVYDGLKRV